MKCISTHARHAHTCAHIYMIPARGPETSFKASGCTHIHVVHMVRASHGDGWGWGWLAHWLAFIGFSLIFIDFHWFSLVFIGFHWFFIGFSLVFLWFSLIFIGFHWFSLIFICFLLVYIGFHWFSVAFIGFSLVFHWFSLIFIDFHWFSLVFIGFQVGRAGRDTVRGWPADGQILSGGVAWQAGGQEAEEKK